MAHPYADTARSGSKAKFKAISGREGSGQGHPDESQDRKMIRAAMGAHDKQLHGGKRTELGKAIGKAAGGRIDKFARGGKVKGKVNINIIVPRGEPSAVPPLPAAMGPPGGMPMGPPVPPGMPPGPPSLPQGMPPMKKSGGSISGLSTKENLSKWSERAARNSKFASGGKVTGQKGGAETGVGRLDKIKMQRRARG